MKIKRKNENKLYKKMKPRNLPMLEEGETVSENRKQEMEKLIRKKNRIDK